MNLVDWLILITFLFALFDGWRRGLVALVLDLVALVVGIWIAFSLYLPIGNFLGSLGLSDGLQPILGFFLALLIVESILRVVFGLVARIIPGVLGGSIVSRTGGSVVAVFKQCVVLTLLINLLLFLPVVPQIRNAIQESMLGPKFAVQTPVFERAFSQIITPAIRELQTQTTITKITESAVDIDTPITVLSIDSSAEQELYRLVNQERRSRGLGELKWSDDLTDVARVHSKDMWQRQFFAHVNPSGQTPFDRIDAYGINYIAAGENLALAPTTPIAHQGLMDSPGHRENILNQNYGTIGIGAVRNGLYGVMYTQLFTN